MSSLFGNPHGIGQALEDTNSAKIRHLNMVGKLDLYSSCSLSLPLDIQ